MSLGPLHGYGILLRIQEISQRMLQIEQGSLYPALYRLELAGLIVSEWPPRLESSQLPGHDLRAR